jgi:hypothetical protein
MDTLYIIKILNIIYCNLFSLNVLIFIFKLVLIVIIHCLITIGRKVIGEYETPFSVRTFFNIITHQATNYFFDFLPQVISYVPGYLNRKKDLVFSITNLMFATNASLSGCSWFGIAGLSLISFSVFAAISSNSEWTAAFNKFEAAKEYSRTIRGESNFKECMDLIFPNEEKFLSIYNAPKFFYEDLWAVTADAEGNIVESYYDWTSHHEYVRRGKPLELNPLYDKHVRLNLSSGPRELREAGKDFLDADHKKVKNKIQFTLYVLAGLAVVFVLDAFINER